MSKLLRTPLILITNDDGIDSYGLRIITEIVKDISSNYVVVAPIKNCSGYGHSITLSKPLRLDCINKKTYLCDGTPTDCIMLARQEIFKGKTPDLIISGINIGENLGDDVSYSGTVGAAIEGAMTGIKSIAISKSKPVRNERDDWSAVKEFIPSVIQKFIQAHNLLINVNVPNSPKNKIRGLKHTKLARRKPKGKFLIRKDNKDLQYFWLTTKRTNCKIENDTDLWAIKNNFISITPLSYDMTNYNEIDK